MSPFRVPGTVVQYKDPHAEDRAYPAVFTWDEAAGTVDVKLSAVRLGHPLAPQLQGRSLLPICRDPEVETRAFLFGERNWHVQRGCGRLVRQGDWVYLRDYTPGSYSFQMVNHKDGAYAELLRLRDEDKLSAAEAEVFSNARPEELLFNVAEDPKQLNNLAANPEHQQTLETLRRALEDWQARTGDSIPELEQMTPDRHDRETFERLYPGRRPKGGIVAGQEAGAACL